MLPLAGNAQIRLIAVSTPEWLAAAPDLPTVAETVPGFISFPGTAFSRPLAPRQSIIEAIRTELAAFVKKPDIAKRLTDLGIVPGGMTGGAIETMFQKEHATFAGVVKYLAIQPN